MSQYLIPASGLVAIAPSNTVDISTRTRAIWVGTGGDVRILCSDGSEQTLQSVPSGSLIPIFARRVMATGTTAAAMVGMI